jgi:predicted Zn-dependent peptidase
MRLYQQSQLKNGLVIITSEDNNSDIVSVSLDVAAGSRYEAQHERGCAHLLEHLLLKGTVSRPSVEDISTIADTRGALFNAQTNTDTVELYFQVAHEDVEPLFALLADIVANPLLAPEILENEKKVVREEIKRFLDTKSSRLWWKSRHEVFGFHPLSQHPLGEESAVDAITLEGLRSYYSSTFLPHRSVLSAGGNITHAQVISLAKRYGLAEWQPIGRSRENSYRMPTHAPGEFFIEDNGEQTQLYFNFLLPPLSLRESVMAELVANMLGYGKAPLLMRNLRHRRGLVYTVGSYVMKFEDVTLFYISTASTNPREVIDEVWSTLNNFGNTLTHEQLNISKSQYRGILARNLYRPFIELNFLASLYRLYHRFVTPAMALEELGRISVRDVIDFKDSFLQQGLCVVTILGSQQKPGT